jgi:hypothetical protein
VKCSASKDQAACNDLPSEGQAQDTHVLCAIGRAWDWRWRRVSGEFGTDRSLAIAVGRAERHVSRQ